MWRMVSRKAGLRSKSRSFRFSRIADAASVEPFIDCITHLDIYKFPGANRIMGLKRDILIGLAVIAVILLIVSALVGLIIVLSKAVGMLLILAGIFLIIFFPDIAEAQPHEMSKTGIVLGIALIIVGILLLVL